MTFQPGLKCGNHHGLGRHFGDRAYLNLESAASIGKVVPVLTDSALRHGDIWGSGWKHSAASSILEPATFRLIT
jgi:hypothetical protein